MSDKTEKYETPLDEVLKRVRRIETRQMKMAREQGIDPSQGRDRVVLGASMDPDVMVLDVTGLDVSLGDLVDFCRKSGISRTVIIEYRGTVLGSFRLGEGNGNNKKEQACAVGTSGK